MLPDGATRIIHTKKSSVKKGSNRKWFGVQLYFGRISLLLTSSTWGQENLATLEDEAASDDAKVIPLPLL